MSVGRKRKHNKHLPRGVTLEYGCYYFRGPDRKRVNLGRSFSEAMSAYGELLGDVPLCTLGDVLDRYQHAVVPEKAPRTQADNLIHLQAIRLVFGYMSPSGIDPVHIYAFRDKLATKSVTQANQHLALLKHVFVKAIEWGACKQHPARDVKKLPVPARTRYVEDWEYDLVYELAPERVQVAMDLAVLTALRRGDILSLQRSQVREDGLHVTIAKTVKSSAKKIIIEWSDELRSVIDRAKRIRPQVRQHIVANRFGKPYTADGFSSVWGKVMDEAMTKGLEERFHFHDLRAKSATDGDDLLTSSERLGHSSPEITKRVYRRKPTRVKPLR